MQIFISGFIAGSIGAYIYENSISKITGKKKLVISGYELHHSLYGILFILLGIYFKESFILLVSVGLGVIVEHYLTGGGFDFITKEGK